MRRLGEIRKNETLFLEGRFRKETYMRRAYGLSLLFPVS
jgi:hypothetical protein